LKKKMATTTGSVQDHPIVTPLLNSTLCEKSSLELILVQNKLHDKAQSLIKPSPWKSLVAGATAGAIEGAATYPFEYAKTMMQFAPDAKIGVPGTSAQIIVSCPSLPCSLSVPLSSKKQ
jgi:hypothetical protein